LSYGRRNFNPIPHPFGSTTIIYSWSFLYVLPTPLLPTSRETTLGTFPDDTATFATHEVSMIASLNLQEHFHVIEKSLKKFKININESKSSPVKFPLRNVTCPAVNINQTTIPRTEAVKCPVLHFDCRLNRKEYNPKKNRNKNKRQSFCWGKISHLSTENNSLIYKAVIKLIKSYGLVLWGCQNVKHSNNAVIVIMQSTQFKIL